MFNAHTKWSSLWNFSKHHLNQVLDSEERILSYHAKPMKGLFYFSFLNGKKDRCCDIFPHVRPLTPKKNLVGTNKYQLILPVSSVDLISAGTWLSTGCWEGTAFSVGFGRTGTPDGTSAARSGGWSFPTSVVACYEALPSLFSRKRINMKLPVHKINKSPPDLHMTVAFQ